MAILCFYIWEFGAKSPGAFVAQQVVAYLPAHLTGMGQVSGLQLTHLPLDPASASPTPGVYLAL